MIDSNRLMTEWKQVNRKNSPVKSGLNGILVHVIEAAPMKDGKAMETKQKLRVAAYCRVSTDSEEQESSYEVQCSHYQQKIKANEEWILAGIYADEGISGTSLKNRTSFHEMIREAEAGNIDIILTKSISRFARNTLDCLAVIRQLKSKGVGVVFEKEGLNTMDESSEVILTILASIAQQESASISKNVRMGIQYRFQQGIPRVNCTRFLGYEKDEHGKLIVNPEQAAVVRRIYRDFLDGFSMDMIAADLRKEGVSSGTGNNAWPVSSVRYILTNEKYAGDLLLQKTLVEDFLSHKLVINKGQLPKYYVRDAHEAIIPREVFERVQEEIELRSKKRNRYGSRQALIGRTFCSCGEQMQRLRRKVTVWRCSCGFCIEEERLKAVVLTALKGADLQNSAQKKEKSKGMDAEDMRAEWQRWNCFAYLKQQESSSGKLRDFRMQTNKALNGWEDDILIRVFDRVIVSEKVILKGGCWLEIP